ncbi:BQ5605_C002g01130 [Microbotryum silenes-dioicae]|uniref:BQ5605_C002g01130 protein n=1 Tax=Microbotryum silenes-dioicae TaxID=796604 RepID=A0A2X0M2E1_9BASI|nr:BQ5605_C002g01130 [Microbotryum silenes-dioicae]
MTFSQPSNISHNLPEPRASSRLYLVAHEASLIRGHPDWARSVQMPSSCTSSLTTDASGRTRMMRWEAGSGAGFDHREGDQQQEIWIDRYDALNLLSSLPILESTTTPLLPPDLGFEDLPDDAEEMFYFEPEERELIERERKSKRLELGREERIKALKREEEEEEEEEHENEETEPSETQLALMKKLHTTLSNAADPSLLEIRIMANHGRDPRFDFLRKEGKWSDVWERIKKGEPVGEEARRNDEENVGNGSGNGLGLGLNGYGSDSEEEEGDTATAEEEDKLREAANETPIPTPSTEEDKDEQERRAKKAEKIKEWARKRKEAREKEADKTQEAS